MVANIAASTVETSRSVGRGLGYASAGAILCSRYGIKKNSPRQREGLIFVALLLLLGVGIAAILAIFGGVDWYGRRT
jgi:hypothetical protein